ncbi:MAG: hypothetical protein MUD03_15400 [Pirellula sp.]|nr:hypothetical protein [Pirellula sp.]
MERRQPDASALRLMDIGRQPDASALRLMDIGRQPDASALRLMDIRKPWAASLDYTPDWAAK